MSIYPTCIAEDDGITVSVGRKPNDGRTELRTSVILAVLSLTAFSKIFLSCLSVILVGML